MDVLTLPGQKSRAFGEIRAALDVYFPGTRFRMEARDEGDFLVIEISYTDGASLTRVKNALRSFNRPACADIRRQGVKTRVSRHMSAGTKKLLLGELRSVFNLKAIPKEEDFISRVDSTAGDYIGKIFNMRDFE